MAGKKLPNIEATLYYDSPLEVRQLRDGSPQLHWGWRIYRTAYGDDKKFARYMQALLAAVEESLDNYNSPELRPFMDWTVVEGEYLDSLASTGVRRQFGKWAWKYGIPRFEITAMGRSIAKTPDGGFAPYLLHSGSARFHHCLMVDKRSLMSLDSRDPFIAIAEKTWTPPWHPYLLKDEPYFLGERLDLIEGNPDKPLGWWYMPLYILVGEYDSLPAATTVLTGGHHGHQRFTNLTFGMRKNGEEMKMRDMPRVKSRATCHIDTTRSNIHQYQAPICLLSRTQENRH